MTETTFTILLVIDVAMCLMLIAIKEIHERIKTDLKKEIASCHAEIDRLHEENYKLTKEGK